MFIDWHRSDFRLKPQATRMVVDFRLKPEATRMVAGSQD